MADDVTIFRAPRRHTLEELAQRAERPLQEAGAERAVVFGSWARGNADAYSDLDLAVVLRTPLPPLERGGLLKDLLDAIPVGVDLLIYTPEEFERGLDKRVGVFEAIAREGVTIYARSHG